MKWLSILALLVALSAHAVSVKDWEKKSDADQLGYLGFCVVGLVADVAKTDPALALKIKSWYSDKPPGHKYTDGFVDLLTRIVQLEHRAETDKTVDLSKIEVGDIVYNVTAEKFKLPSREAPRELGDFKDAAPAPRPVPSSRPIMVGKIDVSHFAGLKPGDTPVQVASVYGQAVTDDGWQKRYGGGHLIVSYTDGVVNRLEVYSSDLDVALSRAGKDALLDLFGHTEADAVALLGTPKWWEDIDAPTRYLYWNFPMPGHPAGEYANAASDRTLTLEFRPGSGCSRISLKW